MYIDLTTDCGCGCCGLRFRDNNNSEVVFQQSNMDDPRLVSNIDFAIEIWVNFSNTGPAIQIVATNHDSTAANPNGFWALLRTNNNVEFMAGLNVGPPGNFGNRISIVSPPIAFNTWYHIVANRITNNPTNWELYLNGQRIPGWNTINPSPNYDHPLELNRRTVFGFSNLFGGIPGHFSGAIAQARFYTRPLSQAEVRYNLRNGFYKPFSIDDLYFWAPFNNCSGAIADVFTTGVGIRRLNLVNFGPRILPGGGAWGNNCPTETSTPCYFEECFEFPEDELIIKRCDALLFPPYVRDSPSMNFENLNTYNLYVNCDRQRPVQTVYDWRKRILTGSSPFKTSLQTFKLYLNLNELPPVLNLTVAKYNCNERVEILDFEQTFTPPSAVAYLNKLIEWIETNVFENSVISVSGITGKPNEHILTIGVPPEVDICNNQIIALSNPRALRPGQSGGSGGGGGGGGGGGRACLNVVWTNQQGAMESCISQAPPPTTPPAPLCNSQEDSFVPFTSVPQNDLGFSVAGGCITITTPGAYELQYTVNALIEQLFGWLRTAVITGNVHIIVEMIVLDQTYPIYNYNYVKNAAPTAPNCNGGSTFWNPTNNTETNSNPNAVVSVTLPVTTINVTPTHISNNQNKICLRTFIKTSAQLTCFSCDPNNCNQPPEIVCRTASLTSQTSAACNAISLPPLYPTETCIDQRNGNLLFSNPGIDPGGIVYNTSTGCFEMQTPGVYTIELSNLVATLIFTHRTSNANLALTNHLGCLQLKIANLAPILLTTACPVTLYGHGNTNNCYEDLAVSNVGPTINQTITVNVTPAMISANQNRICFEYNLTAEVTFSGVACDNTAPATTLAITDVTLTGSMKICRGTLLERYVEAIGDVTINGSLNLCRTTSGGGGGSLPSNWYGSGEFTNNRDRFLEDCFNVKSCFTGIVFWTNLCLSLWQDVICISDNGTEVEVPCNLTISPISTGQNCAPGFNYFRIGFSYQDLFLNKHIAFCSQKIRLKNDCDTILIRFKNENEVYKTVRIEGFIEKIGFNKTQEVSYSSKGINRKLYSAVSKEWILTTNYYTEKFHKHLMRALESDYFEAEINGEWHRFIFEDNYSIEWNEEDPNLKKGKAVIKLKSYQRDVYNDFCVFER